MKTILSGFLAILVTISGISQQPDSLKAVSDWFPAAEIAFDSGNFSDAESLLTRAIQVLPDFRDAYALRGRVFMQQQNAPQAIKDFDQALRLKSDDPVSMADRALAWWHMNAPLAAEADARTAIRLEPEYPEGHYVLGLALFSTRQYSAAELKFSQTIELDSGHANAWYNRGICRMYIDKRESGCRDWEQAQYLGFEVDPELIQEYCPKTED